ncbi:MAG: hypothetical protein IT308_07820 [Anaerolineaceae bacterium]|nr:hypothetical protein [Anaerolineaceae bacterium]
MMKSDCDPVNNLYRAMIEGVSEIIGTAGMTAVENSRASQEEKLPPEAAKEQPIDQLVSWMAALEQVFGVRAGEGIALRGGRNSFLYLTRTTELGTTFSAMMKRLLPASARIKNGLEILAGSVAQETGLEVEVIEKAEHWNWQMPDCFSASSSGGQNVARYFLIGLLEEFTAWVSGGRHFNISEGEGGSAGAGVCLIQINKQPMD